MRNGSFDIGSYYFIPRLESSREPCERKERTWKRTYLGRGVESDVGQRRATAPTKPASDA